MVANFFVIGIGLIVLVENPFASEVDPNCLKN